MAINQKFEAMMRRIVHNGVIHVVPSTMPFAVRTRK
jgi:hypothetical protein